MSSKTIIIQITKAPEQPKTVFLLTRDLTTSNIHTADDYVSAEVLSAIPNDGDVAYFEAVQDTETGDVVLGSSTTAEAWENS